MQVGSGTGAEEEVAPLMDFLQKSQRGRGPWEGIGWIKRVVARHRGHTPIILATWEAEIRRITIRGQTEQKVRPYLKNTQRKKRADGAS
jgi:hypothetical protein